MEQKLEELKRSIEDQKDPQYFDKQKDSLREIISEICSALFDSFKKDLKEEMKKEMDEQITKISSENCMFQNQILDLKQANVKLQNELDELEQYGRRSCIRIDGILEVSNESSEDVLITFFLSLYELNKILGDKKILVLYKYINMCVEAITGGCVLEISIPDK